MEEVNQLTIAIHLVKKCVVQNFSDDRIPVTKLICISPTEGKGERIFYRSGFIGQRRSKHTSWIPILILRIEVQAVGSGTGYWTRLSESTFVLLGMGFNEIYDPGVPRCWTILSVIRLEVPMMCKLIMNTWASLSSVYLWSFGTWASLSSFYKDSVSSFGFLSDTKCSEQTLQANSLLYSLYVQFSRKVYHSGRTIFTRNSVKLLPQEICSCSWLTWHMVSLGSIGIWGSWHGSMWCQDDLCGPLTLEETMT